MTSPRLALREVVGLELARVAEQDQVADRERVPEQDRVADPEQDQVRVRHLGLVVVAASVRIERRRGNAATTTRRESLTTA